MRGFVDRVRQRPQRDNKLKLSYLDNIRFWRARSICIGRLPSSIPIRESLNTVSHKICTELSSGLVAAFPRCLSRRVELQDGRWTDVYLLLSHHSSASDTSELRKCISIWGFGMLCFDSSTCTLFACIVTTTNVQLHYSCSKLQYLES